MSDARPAEARWRDYVAPRAVILNAAAKRVPLASLASQARALSIWDGKQARPGSGLMLACLLDLGVMAPVGGHGRAIDRFARAAPPPAGTVESRLLDALVAARFGFYRTLGPHPGGGVMAVALPGGAEVRLFDSFLGAKPPGLVVGARIAWPEADVAMTCGALAPLDSRALERLLLALPPDRGPVLPLGDPLPEDAARVDALLGGTVTRQRLGDLLQAPDVTARVYRASLDVGLLGAVPGRTPPEAMPQTGVPAPI